MGLVICPWCRSKSLWIPSCTISPRLCKNLQIALSKESYLLSVRARRWTALLRPLTRLGIFHWSLCFEEAEQCRCPSGTERREDLRISEQRRKVFTPHRSWYQWGFCLLVCFQADHSFHLCPPALRSKTPREWCDGEGGWGRKRLGNSSEIPRRVVQVSVDQLALPSLWLSFAVPALCCSTLTWRNDPGILCRFWSGSGLKTVIGAGTCGHACSDAAFLTGFRVLWMGPACGCRRNLEGKLPLILVYGDPGNLDGLQAPPLPVHLSPRHPAPQERCNPHILKSAVWLCFVASRCLPSSIVVFILLLLLERVSASGCHYRKCFPDLASFSVSSLSLCAHPGPGTDSPFFTLNILCFFVWISASPTRWWARQGLMWCSVSLAPSEASPHSRCWINICRVRDDRKMIGPRVNKAAADIRPHFFGSNRNLANPLDL